ncbi:hypothetical protein CICLE_v10024558mg [Citrus x clementina]|uniref:Myb/SANT-like domain-containing protein n=1 Tax=Citrus clementina TaxID=85681 RepID=V4TVW0_CITCL|nr:hypothetical protein CICLE_v10024558mg [Citrus x clementina]
MWRVDCGFKTGYLNQLESMLELKIPGCGLKASPHIESRVKYFKLKHNVVADMLALSGFGWDSEKSMIVCDKSVYDEYVKGSKLPNRATKTSYWKATGKDRKVVCQNGL